MSTVADTGSTLIGSTPVVEGQHILATAPTGSSAPDNHDRRQIDLGGIRQWCQLRWRERQQHYRSVQHERSG